MRQSQLAFPVTFLCREVIGSPCWRRVGAKEAVTFWLHDSPFKTAPVEEKMP
jgi:hypothetical protein